MYNIEQITNYDIENLQNFVYNIKVPYKKGKEILFKTIPYNYKEITNKKYIKIGYCCEPKGIDYPIFINNKEFKIGKTCMLEIETDIPITSIKLPSNIKFTFEAVTAT